MRDPDLWTMESAAAAQGYQRICGVDEAGAGPLAGRVYAAAVILPQEFSLPGLTDSKKLSEKKRDVLFDQIKETALAFAIAYCEVEEVEALNILGARMLAMERAILALEPRADFALIDGNRNKGITTPNEMVVKGDEMSASIAAASILAKVTRDRYMLEMAALYPQYAFEKHKGYGTKLHYERLREHGISPIHRRSFLKNL